MDRRDFLKALAAASLPLSLVRGTGSCSESFLLCSTGDYWPVHDPVAWALENAQQPILERAKLGLSRLSVMDSTRVVRLVTRRCKLNVLEVESNRVVVHGWGKNGFGDLRPFFKQRELARSEVEVALIDRKKETCVRKLGDDFLFGEGLFPDWPLQTYLNKWHRRFQSEQDDWTAAEGTCSGFGWDGIEPNLIPWAAMKSAWRRTTPNLCLNCNQQTLLVNFGLVQCGICNRLARFVHACGDCRRSFNDDTIRSFQVTPWLVKNLDAAVWPTVEIIWGNCVKWSPTLEKLDDVSNEPVWGIR